MRTGKAVYVVLSGCTHAVCAGYTVQGGLHRQFFSAGPGVSFTGAHTIADVTISGKAYKLLTLTSSGTLSVSGDGVQYWMCGGGAGGGVPTSSSNDAPRRFGGGGGYLNTGELTEGKYAVVIGAGGRAETAGNSTTLTGGTLDVEAQGAKSSSGASGGGGEVSNNGGKISTYPFGIESLKAHSAGGGAGGKRVRTSNGLRYYKGAKGGSNGSAGASDSYASASTSSTAGIGGDGGEYGGGKGAKWDYTGGNGATFYGGGGGGNGYDTGYYGGATDGYQGVMYVLQEAEG